MSLESRKRCLESLIDRSMTELEFLSSLPEDDFPEGAVVVFDKQFCNHPSESQSPPYDRMSCTCKKYSYAAIKAGGAWYTTGPKRGGPYRWEEMLDFWSSGVKSVYYVTEMEEQPELVGEV